MNFQFFLFFLVFFAISNLAWGQYVVDSVFPSPLRNPQWPAGSPKSMFSKSNNYNIYPENVTDNGELMNTMARDLRILAVINLMQQVFLYLVFALKNCGIFRVGNFMRKIGFAYSILNFNGFRLKIFAVNLVAI